MSLIALMVEINNSGWGAASETWPSASPILYSAGGLTELHGAQPQPRPRLPHAAPGQTAAKRGTPTRDQVLGQGLHLRPGSAISLLQKQSYFTSDSARGRRSWKVMPPALPQPCSSPADDQGHGRLQVGDASYLGVLLS